MDNLHQIINTLSLTMGVGWASGINLYATILVLGILGKTGNIALPANLHVLMNPMVIGAAGIMYITEFIADKIPGIDNGWDTLHTFIRIPAGAILSASAVGNINPAVAVAAGILGGSMAAGAHATKSGSRIIVNTSPEPFTNWAISITEDVGVIGGLWTALHHPWFFLGLMLLFLLFMIWILPKIWGAIKKIFGFIRRLFGFGDKNKPVPPGKQTVTDINSTLRKNNNEIETAIIQLNDLLKKGLISDKEYRKKKEELLSRL